MDKVLITCTSPRAHDYVTDLQSRNIDAIALPALKVSPLNTKMPTGAFEAMVITSAHAFQGDLPDLPVIAVGDNTSKLAREKGFTVTHSGDGGIEDLDLSPYKNLLYACATSPTHVPNNCTPWPVYQTQANPEFHIPNDSNMICVFSVRAGQIIQKYPLHGKTVLCLSQKIADVFQSLRNLKLAVAYAPRYDAMISLIDSVRGDTYMTHTNGLNNVETLINRFGGMRPMARKMDVAVSTIQGWKKRDHIPSERVDEVIAAARANHVSLDGFNIPAATNENIKRDETNPAETAVPTPSAVAPKTTAPKGNTHGTYTMDARKMKSDVVKRSVITTVSVLAIVGALGYALFGTEAKQVATMAQDQQRMEQEVSNIRGQFESFETTVTDGLNTLNTQVTGLANAVGIERNAEGQFTVNDMPLSQRVENLENRLQNAGQEIDLGALVSRFENLTQTVSGQEGDTAQAFSDLQSIVNTLQARMATLDANLEQAKAENEELAQSMRGVTGRDLSAAAMLLAMTQMRDSMNRSEPFADDLAILQELVGNDDPELTAAINRLAPYAESGILTPEGLSNELRGVTGEVVAAALRGEDVSIQDKIMARLGQILSVQKDGQPLMGIEEQAIIARAQSALDNGDVATALNELNKLEGDAANAAGGVTNQMQGAVQADQTISMMMETLLNRLQNPQSLEGFIRDIPRQIERQMQGTLTQDEASGIIILE